MKLTNTLLSLAIILSPSCITYSMQINPKVATCLSDLVTEIEDHQLPFLLDSIDQAPVVLAQLIGQFTGPIILKYPPVRAKRDSKITFCRLCPKGEWLLTISSIGLLNCQEIQSGKRILSHCVGNFCTDAVIDSDHENILVASNNDGHNVYHIDTKTGAKTNITKIFVPRKPQRAFQFYPMDDPNHTVVVNDPSYCFDIKNKRAYHQLSRQDLYERLSSVVTWESDRIELKTKRCLQTWATVSTTTQAIIKLPEGIKNIKKVLHTPSGIIGIAKNGTIFDLASDSIHIVSKIEGGFSDIDIKGNTMAVSYPTGDVALFKIYRVMGLLKAYLTQIDKLDSDSDTED